MDSDTPLEFKPSDAAAVLARAYIPEHIPALMTAISRASPFLLESYLGYTKDNWVIFIGYPLEGQFDPDRCGALVEGLRQALQPDYIWFIGPKIPPGLSTSCRNRQSDQYYLLDLGNFRVKSSLQRQVKRAAAKLTVEQTRVFSPEHQSIVGELMQRQKLPPMIAELYRSMPDYVARCQSARVLDARDSDGRLTAFFVVETAAPRFDTYILGSHSKKNYIPHASDLLFAEMVDRTRERAKTSINLGLGVNAGIRRFKVKWGGQPTMEYEFCECHYGPPEPLSVVDLLLGNL